MFSIEGDGGGVRSLVHRCIRDLKLSRTNLTYMVLDVTPTTSDGYLHVAFTGIVNINCNVKNFIPMELQKLCIESGKNMYLLHHVRPVLRINPWGT